MANTELSLQHNSRAGIKRLQPKTRKNGFSMPEVLVSSSILMLVVAGTAQSQLNSVIHTTHAGEQNAVQARISEDLDALKREAFRWQCTSGTSCTGDVQFEDIPMRYNTTHAALTSACNAQTMGGAMLSDKPTLFPTLAVLSWQSDAPKEAQEVQISREITANGNEVEVRYTTSGSSRELDTTTSIIPQAASWCA
jgi:Tfp pilus assembly protein PilV|tara:strand:+ start:577 stop:1161 length:585 start_codon:yes stop_codon:yes gene_type:complete